MTNIIEKYNLDMEKILKNSKFLDLEKEILDDLKTQKDINDWIAIIVEEYLEDGDLKHFFSCLEYAEKAKNLLNANSKKTNVSKIDIHKILNGETQPQFNTIMKIFKELGYSLQPHATA